MSFSLLRVHLLAFRLSQARPAELQREKQQPLTQTRSASHSTAFAATCVWLRSRVNLWADAELGCHSRLASGAHSRPTRIMLGHRLPSVEAAPEDDAHADDGSSLPKCSPSSSSASVALVGGASSPTVVRWVPRGPVRPRVRPPAPLLQPSHATRSSRRTSPRAGGSARRQRDSRYQRRRVRCRRFGRGFD